MAKIERYESRLSVMAYMGYFDELVESVMPVRHVTFVSMFVVRLMIFARKLWQSMRHPHH